MRVFVASHVQGNESRNKEIQYRGTTFSLFRLKNP